MKFFNIKKNKFNLILLALFFNSFIWGQLNLPYSSLGFGEEIHNDNIANRGMGGVSIANFDYYNNNIKNPASYGMARNLEQRNIFVDFGIDIKSQELIDKTTTTPNLNTNFSYLYLGFPIKKKMGIVLGFQPINLVSYNLQKTEKNTVLDTGGLFVNKKGFGGAYQYFAGFGHQINNHFSYGVNIGYFYANNVSEYNIFPSTDNTALKIGTLNSLYSSGLRIEYGLLYSKLLKENANGNLNLQIGLNGVIPFDLSSSYSKLVRSVYSGSDGSINTLDTISNVTNESGSINTPLNIGVGALIHKQENWKLGFDVLFTKYANWNLPNQSTNFINKLDYKMGVEFIPNIKSLSYLAQLPYRFGIKIGNYYVNNNNLSLIPWSISMGMGIWIKKYSYTFQTTMINLSFEYQRRGNTNHTFYENFYTLSIGFALTDLWFRKQKFY